MFKKITGVVLAAAMMCSTGALCASAAETTADTVSDDEQVVYFDVAKSGWEGVSAVYCHIWAADGTETTNTGASWTQWQTKKERCTYDKETGIATYKLSKVDNTFSTDDGKIYCVIFSTDSGQQTFDTIMSGSCIGDTAYCEGGLVENPQDSQKTCYLAKWTKEENADCGAVKTITSLGNVVGTGTAEGVTDDDLFAGYMIGYYNDADKMANVQNIINNEALSLTEEGVDASLATKLKDNADKDTILAAINAVLDNCTFPAAEPDYVLGDVNGDGEITIDDATTIQKYSASIADLTADRMAAADVDGDGEVNINDVTCIQKYLASVIEVFPAAAKG